MITPSEVKTNEEHMIPQLQTLTLRRAFDRTLFRSSTRYGILQR